MGSVGNFLFGGSQQKQKSQNSSTSTSTNQSQNTSGQASAGSSSNFQKSGSQGYNQAYAPVAAALSPALGYTTQAGDAMAALLGLPASSFSYTPTTYTPPSSVLPAGGASASPSLPSLDSIIKQIAGAIPRAPTSPVAAPVPSTGIVAPTYPTPTYSGGSSGGAGRTGRYMEARALGGPVNAGQPYVVGEQRPEVFVPQQNGYILPHTGMMNTMFGGGDFFNNRFNRRRDRNPGIVPPAPVPPTPAPVPPAPPPQTTVSTQVNPNVDAPSALQNYANSAGLGFVLDQGQRALSGASAANGTFNSGATGQALVEYGQNLGNTYLDQYLQRLNQYGQLGLGAASALTGAGGVNTSQSTGGGASRNVSGGYSQGTSLGTSTASSQGTGSGSGNSKNGLVPAILG